MSGQGSGPGVTSNAFTYLVAQLITWSVTFLTISVIPRRLGEAGMGQITLAGVYVAPAVSALTFGIEEFLTAEVARDRSQTGPLLRALLGLRLACLAPMLLVGALLLSVTHPGQMVWTLGVLNLLAATMGYMADPMRAVLRGWEDARRVSAVDILTTLAPLLAIPFLHHGPRALAVTGLVVSVVVVIVRATWVGRHVQMRPELRPAIWLHLIRGGLPFLTTFWILQLYGFASVYILRSFTDETTVGVFSQAQRLFGTLMFFPTALSSALLPAMARLAEADPVEFRGMQSRVLSLMVVIGLPVMVMAIGLAHPLAALLYGANRFVGVPFALQAFALGVIPVYVVSVMYNFLVAQRRNGLWTLFLLGTVAIHALASVWLVPLARARWANGAAGTALATTIAEFVSMACAIGLLRSSPMTPVVWARVARSAIAAACMAGVIWAARGLFIVIPAALGLGVYGLMGWRMRVLGDEEHSRLVAALRSRLKMGRRTP